ncbi:Uncharacterised protein [Vibrio cholerae]|nr:Uncharacterised protein [Vibrio cholerae]
MFANELIANAAGERGYASTTIFCRFTAWRTLSSSGMQATSSKLTFKNRSVTNVNLANNSRPSR